jgi:hypothetical protein
MNKTTTSTTAKPSKEKTVTTSSNNVDELSSLALAGKELEDAQRAQTGSQNSFISLLHKAKSKSDPAYIAGAKEGSYVIASKSLLLGQALDATVLGVFKVYAEVVAPDKGTQELPKTVGFWMPENAMQVPLGPNEMFNRLLPNGHLLQPTHWVFVYLHEHPEIENALIPFKSVGNKICAKLQKLLKAESEVCTELRFMVASDEEYNKDYRQSYYYPSFEISGRNYVFEDGKVAKVKLDKEVLKDILVRSRKLHDDYEGMKMVAARSVEALSEAHTEHVALPEYEVADENVKF